MSDDSRLDILSKKITIQEINEYFNLQDAKLQNIGHSFFLDQLIVTIQISSSRQVIKNADANELVTVNFIFKKIGDLKINTYFTCESNIIRYFSYEEDNDDSCTILFIFQSNNEDIKFSFRAKEFEYDFLNPYLG